MRLFFNFTENRIIFDDHGNYYSDILELKNYLQNQQIKQLIVINGPGSYIGTRQAINICKSIQFIYPIPGFSFNLLRDMATMLSPQIEYHCFKHLKLIYIYNSTEKKFSIQNNWLTNVLFTSNQEDQGLYIDYSPKSIINSFQHIILQSLQQEYFDKFI